MDRNERQPDPTPSRPEDRGRGTGAGQSSGAPAHQEPDPSFQPPGYYPPEHQPYAPPPYGGHTTAPPTQPGQQPVSPPAQGGWAPRPGQPGQAPYGQPSYQAEPRHRVQYPPDRAGFSAGPPVAPEIGQHKKGSILPALFFGLLAIVLGGIAAYLFVQEQEPSGPVAPTALPAENTFIQVQTALQDAGLTATTERQNATSPEAFPTREPGQAILIDDHNAWIYIFPSVEAQEAATAAYDTVEDRPVVMTASGTQLTTGPPTLFSGSNVIILLSLDAAPDDEIQDRVGQAVMSLP